MIIKTTPIERFKDFQGMSYSRLSKLADSPQAYRASLAGEDDSPAMSLGSAIDLMLTNLDNFDKEIYVMSAEKPGSDMMRSYCEVLALTGDEVQAHTASKYQISLERTKDKFEKEGKNYYDALIQAGDRKIIDVEQMFKANQIVNTLKANQFTKRYFEPNDHIMFQVPLTWEEDITILDDPEKTTRIQFKGILDIVEIDHQNRIITPIDLKTGEEPFRKAFFKYKRYLQGAMYKRAIMFNQDKIDSYTVANPKFIYADTNLVYPPVIYTMSDLDVMVGTYGLNYMMVINKEEDGINNDRYLDRFRYKGYRQLAAEMDWHNRMDAWEYSYDVYQNKGEIEIDAFSLKF